MSMIVNMPIGGYPLAMYGMIALTTGILAYATISSGSSSGSAEESATGSADGKSMLSGLFGSSESKDESKDESKRGIMDSLGDIMSSDKEIDPVSTTKPINGGGSRRRKNRKTKNKRRKNRSEKRKA